MVDSSVPQSVPSQNTPAQSAPAQNTPTLSIGRHVIGTGHPVFVIAEIGINHNGSFETAKRLVDAAKEAQASAVKFQMRNLDLIYTRNVLDHIEQQEQPFQYLLPVLREMELRRDEMAKLKEYCDSIDITFLCTPFDTDSACFLNEIGTPAFKISSADLTDLELLEKVSSFGKPVILSTGMSVEDEIVRTVEFLDGLQARYVLLHCVSCYPVDPGEAHMNRIRYLKEKYGCIVGYSGHDIGVALSVVAVSLGACVVEKHLTLNNQMRGPDHKISLVPAEFARLVASVRDAELALGERKTSLLQGEFLNKMVFRKSLVASRAIRKGETITRDMLMTRSPGTGISPQRIGEVVGATASRNIEEQAPVCEDSIAEPGKEENYGFGWGRFGLPVRYHDFEAAAELHPESLEFHLTYNDTLLDIPVSKLEENKAWLSRLPLRVHCCEYIGERLFDLCSPYPEILKSSISTLQRVIDITHDLSEYFSDDPPLIVFNVGAMTLRFEVRGRDIDKEGFYSMMAGIDTRGAVLLAQTMPPDPWYFGGQWKGHFFVDPRELVEFSRMTGHQICLDLSHAYMACRFLNLGLREYLSSLKPYVRHIHIADARAPEGEGIQIGEGDVDFKVFFDVFREYGGTWIPEVWLGHVNRNEGFRTALRRLGEIYSRAER